MVFSEQRPTLRQDGVRSGRLAREDRTLGAMVRLFCRATHGTDRLCAECGELLDYSRQRLQRCPYQAGKTTCALCPVHCYKADMRERVREVMRFSGPRMPARHPVLCLMHVMDSRRKEPIRTPRSA